MTEAHRAAEMAARASYGRLVAILFSRSRDIAAAEDALADAFRAALEHWPRSGVPDSPEAWLLVAARRSLGKTARHAKVRAAARETIGMLSEEMQAGRIERYGDRRLGLMFACAHPAIDPALHTPLMLQTVLGLDAARIGAAFLVAPSAMGQRLVRAKAKIRDAGIPFEVPDIRAVTARVDAVLDAIYAAFGTGWDAVEGAVGAERGLAEEALHLGRLAAALLPAEAETQGLLALMLHAQARKTARRAGGRYMPLAAQDDALWDRAMMSEAETLLASAARMMQPGRYQTEAAIQSLHVAARLTGRDFGAGLLALYDALALQAPSMGALVGQAAAHGRVRGPEAGLAMLDALPTAAAERYQPWWAARAHLLSAAGRDAGEVYSRAIGLAADPQVRDFLAAARDR